MYKTLKNLIPIKAKVYIKSFLYKKEIIFNQNKKAFVFLAADYGNIGDIAISTAQKHFLDKELREFEIISIPISKTRVLINSIKKQVNNNDLITIVGGGNMGSLYPDIEELRQLVIRSFPHNRIVCFPQTLDWDESDESRKALQRIVKVYSRHSDLHIFARESITYTKLKELFERQTHTNISLVPDIVMSATADTLGAMDDVEPNGILCCLRDDKESALTAEQRLIIDNLLETTGHAIQKTDTHAGGSQLDDTHCAKLLADKLNQFRAAKLVITDRLHGMILCLLSGTPCLVLPNSNHKIKRTWLDWLQNHPRLIFFEHEQLAEIPNYINQLLTTPRGALNQSPIDSNQYDSLRKALIK